MTLAQELFAEYVFAERAGEGDPRPFLNRAEPGDRENLSEMIDAYLAAAPGKSWDPDAFDGSPAQGLVEPLSRALDGVSGTWPVLLPSLRERARIKRGDLVARLAEKIGFPEQSEVVGEYYHGMEYGTVESSGVSSTVLEALGEILGSSRRALRQSGEMMGGGEASLRSQAVFTREVPAGAVPFALEERVAEDDLSNAARPSDPDRDAVVELFTGGQ